MSLRKKWEDAALARGIEQGIERVLLNLLQLKFGDIGDAGRERVEHASREELERWAGRVLSATSLDDVFDPRDP